MDDMSAQGATLINKWPAPDVEVFGGRVKILRSGFPINFDNKPSSVPEHRIALTTMLMAAGIFQACLLAHDAEQPGLYRLHEGLQVAIIQYWLAFMRFAEPEQRDLPQDRFKAYYNLKESDLLRMCRDHRSGDGSLLPSSLSEKCDELAAEITQFTRNILP
jgi:hypothetical protein